MNIADLFQDIHAEIDMSQCFRLVDRPQYQPEGFDKLVEMLEADADGFYMSPRSFHPYFYAKDGFYHYFIVFDYNVWTDKNYQAFNEAEQFKARREYFRKLYAENDYSTAILMTDKRYRFTLYKELFEKIPMEERFDTFIEIYTRGEYGFDKIDPAFIRQVFNYRYLSKEWKPFESEEEFITVYRGVTKKSSPLDKAYSWTLDKKVAEFFATRFESRGKVITAKVRPKDIICLIDTRNEKEVLILPEDIIIG